MDTIVRFPEVLDMSPYTCDHLLSKRRGVEPTARMEEYRLFAVVNHHGSMDNGHYTCFVRHPRSLWIKCDDAIITKSSVEEVLSSEG